MGTTLWQPIILQTHKIPVSYKYWLVWWSLLARIAIKELLLLKSYNITRIKLFVWQPIFRFEHMNKYLYFIDNSFEAMFNQQGQGDLPHNANDTENVSIPWRDVRCSTDI